VARSQNTVGNRVQEGRLLREALHYRKYAPGKNGGKEFQRMQIRHNLVPIVKMKDLGRYELLNILPRQFLISISRT
jgi:hypothetical protein